MRIEKIQIENITSLRGEHTVDFKKDLIGEDLFAITGPTGSGKSSILTSMTLALFGKGSKTDLSGADFVAQGTREGQIFLTFSSQAKTYMASWSCVVLNKKGEPLAAPRTKREFFQADKEGQWVTLENNPEEVIGLTFDQFSKTVVLNQGEFAKFLTSSFSERRQILEKLYQGEALSGLKSNLNQLCKAQAEELEQLQTKSDSLLPFTKADYQNDLQLLKEGENESKENQELMAKCQTLNTELLRLSELSQSLKRNREKHQNHYTQHQEANLKKIAKKKEHIHQEELYQKATAEQKKERPLLLNAIDQQKENALIKTEIKRLEDERENKKKLITQKRQDKVLLEQTIEQERVHFSDYRSQMIESWQSLNLEDAQKRSTSTEHLLAQLFPLESKKQQLSSKIQQYSADLELEKKQGQQRKEILEKKVLERQKQKESEEKLFGKTSWTEKREQWGQVSQKCEMLVKEFNLSSNQQQMLLKKSKELEGLVFKLEEQCQNLQTQIKLEEKTREVYDLQLALIKVSQANAESEACLACGSSDHQQFKVPTLGEAFNPEKWQQLVNQKDLLSIELHKQQNLNQQTKAEITLAAEKKQTISKELEDLLKQLDIQKTEDHKDLLILVQEKNSFARDQEKKQLELQKSIGQLNHEIEWLEQELTQMRASFQNKTKQNENAQKELAECNKQMSSLKEELPNGDFGTQEIMKQKHCLDQRIESEKRIIKDNLLIDKYQKELDQYNLEQKQAEPILEKACDQLSQNQAKMIETLALLNIKVPNPDFEKILDEKEKAREQLLKDKEKAEYELQQLNQDETYHRTMLSSLDEQKQEILQTSDIHKRKITETIESEELLKQEERKIRWFQKINGLSFETYSHVAYLAYENLIMDHFTPFYEDLIEKLKSEQDKLSDIKSRIALFEKQEKQVKIIKDQINSLKEKHLQYKNLQSLIGKDEFRNFALSIIESELVSLTNKELEKICDGRYQIDLQKTIRGQEYLIVDFWQGGSERKVSTLSGGETFLVSLAMALSLAEMCRGETEIDSFFIDEGFGSLDHDSLEEVIETLYTVRSRGKQIGIISHVKELTGRIPVNIDLRKSSQGESQIQILYN